MACLLCLGHMAVSKSSVSSSAFFLQCNGKEKVYREPNGKWLWYFDAALSVRVASWKRHCIENALEHECFSILIFSCLANSLEVTLRWFRTSLSVRVASWKRRCIENALEHECFSIHFNFCSRAMKTLEVTYMIVSNYFVSSSGVLKETLYREPF